MQRMFDQFVSAPAMAALVLRARRAGLRTGLLSNSWGNEYPREGWDDMFDVIVISGEVGMRKPDRAIFDHTVELLGIPAAETVFVDDLAANVRAAADAGLVGVHHTSYDETLAELEALFGIPLRG
jgi:HAD superfamily hydrolase (TIGR01509 family)